MHLSIKKEVKYQALFILSLFLLLLNSTDILVKRSQTLSVDIFQNCSCTTFWSQGRFQIDDSVTRKTNTALQFLRFQVGYIGKSKMNGGEGGASCTIHKDEE